MAKTNFRCHSFNQNILFPQKRKTKFLSLSACHHDFFLQSGNRKTISSSYSWHKRHRMVRKKGSKLSWKNRGTKIRMFLQKWFSLNRWRWRIITFSFHFDFIPACSFSQKMCQILIVNFFSLGWKYQYRD